MPLFLNTGFMWGVPSRYDVTEAKKRGYKQLYIESFPHFHNAVSLYERKGFVHLDSRIGNSGHSATTIHMLKDI